VPTAFYFAGEGVVNVNKSALFKQAFQEKFPKASKLKAIDLTQFIEPTGVDDAIWAMIQHDLVGGALLYG
jgi:hypothetical protein